MKAARLILFIFLAYQVNIIPQVITDLIKPVHLQAGRTDTLLISDLYYAKDYHPGFISNKNIKVQYNDSAKTLVVEPRDDYQGLDLLKFRSADSIYAIPYYSKIIYNYTFSLRLKENPKKVNLFGNFNGWNRDNLPMKYDKKSKLYSVSVPLEPGNYQYKYYIDGKEILDPANKDSIPNGLGGYNSVIVIPDLHPEKCYLFVNGYEKADNLITISFTYTNNKYRGPVKKDEIIALYNNSAVSPERISTAANKFLITIDSTKLDGENVLRVAVNRNGLPSNFQTLRFYDGEPEGKGIHRTDYDNIIYSIMVDRFKDGDPSNSIPVVNPHLLKKANYYGGDLQGIIDKIDDGYFDSLSVNTLWLSPIVDNTDSAYREYPPPHRWYTGYHGYWPISSTRVEERFGDMSLFKKLIDDAHSHGIHILIDYVAHHVHEEDPLFKGHRDWFGHLRLPDGKLNLRMWDEHRLTTWFEPYLPSFDYVHSQAAVDSMTSNAVWWLKETGADGFRHDAVKHIPNKFWRVLTRKIKSEIVIPDNRDIYQIGETFGSYHLVNSYVNNGQLNAQFNFNLYDTAIPVFIDTARSFKNLDETLQKSFSVYGVNSLMGNIMDSHDKVRFMAYADGDIALNSSDAAEIGWDNPPEVNHRSSYNKLELYLSYLLTIPGIPVIDYGDEIGMTGAADPDNRRMMRFGSQLSDWEKQTLQNVRKIVRVRKENSALRYGDFYTLKADKDTYAFVRSDLNERILVVLNKSGKEVETVLEFPYAFKANVLSDLITGEDKPVGNYRASVTMKPYGYSIFKLKEISNEEE